MKEQMGFANVDKVAHLVGVNFKIWGNGICGSRDGPGDHQGLYWELHYIDIQAPDNYS